MVNVSFHGLFGCVCIYKPLEHTYFFVYSQLILPSLGILVVHGTFFPFLWQPPRPNLITYNFISTHGPHKRPNSVSPNHYGLRSGQPTVLRVQPSLFGARLPEPASRTHPHFFNNRQPGLLPFDFRNSNGIGLFPSDRGGYNVPFDVLAANYFRTFLSGTPQQSTNFYFRTPFNPVILPVGPTRPVAPPNFQVPQNINPLSPPSRSPSSAEALPRFLVPPNVFVRPQNPPLRSYTPFNIPYPLNLELFQL